MKHLNWRIFWKQLRILSTHYGMDVLLKIYCIFSEKHFLRTPLEGCFSLYLVQIGCIPLDRPNYWRVIYKNGPCTSYSQGSLQNKLVVCLLLCECYLRKWALSQLFFHNTATYSSTCSEERFIPRTAVF